MMLGLLERSRRSEMPRVESMVIYVTLIESGFRSCPFQLAGQSVGEDTNYFGL